ncbi:hypothetical protein [Chryseobacterium sp. Marseille-Q3244]|uniref:hypothetical protein n=1 Tax=Chryseobacterium sp. Marseille-Q3244 TaxID=2758092 RepID=UPI0020252671|nr:hypothetical protein [Chryseobacterium sp. Marseille-Q3244]
MKFELSTFKAITSCSILMFANLSAQTTFAINSEVISKLKSEQSMVYPITTKEVEYHPFVKGKVPTYMYGLFLESKKIFEQEYNDYMKVPHKPNSYVPSVVEEYPKMLEEEKSFSEDEKYMDGLVKSNVIAKRNAYIIDRDQPITNIEELKGNYKEISSTMLISGEDVDNRFLKNELSDDLREYLKYPPGKSNTLMQNIDTGKFYLVLYDTFQNIIGINDTGNVEKLLASMGYKTYGQNEQKYITTKHYKIPCDAIFYNTLKRDKDYLKKIDTWFDQMQGLRKQALSYNPKFDNYIRIYRLQRNRMSKADISAWTTLTKSAMALNKQFVALNDKLWGVNYDVLDKSYLKNSNDFDNYLGASMGVLGL